VRDKVPHPYKTFIFLQWTEPLSLTLWYAKDPAYHYEHTVRGVNGLQML
jgi:hypothetical protein